MTKREEGRGKREEGRGQREEGRGKREEGRGKREEGSGKRGGGEETHNKMADTSTTTKNTANQESYDPIPGPWSVRRKN